MKAIAVHHYGAADAFTAIEVAAPAPDSQSVVVAVRASSMNPLDIGVRRGDYKLFSGRRFPKVLGADFAGVVRAVGARVTQWKIGDEVFGFANIMAGDAGANAELVCVRADHVCAKPRELSFAEASTLPMAGLATVIAFADIADRKQTQAQAPARVLVHGASGGVGVFAVQLAKHYGADVTAVCGARNIEFVRGLGADRVLARETTAVGELGAGYDIVFDVAGALGFRAGRRLARRGGTFATTQAAPGVIIAQPFARLVTGVRLRVCVALRAQRRLPALAELVQRGALRPIVDATAPLAQLAELHARAERGNIRGKLVVEG